MPKPHIEIHDTADLFKTVIFRQLSIICFFILFFFEELYVWRGVCAILAGLFIMRVAIFYKSYNGDNRERAFTILETTLMILIITFTLILRPSFYWLSGLGVILLTLGLWLYGLSGKNECLRQTMTYLVIVWFFTLLIFYGKNPLFVFASQTFSPYFPPFPDLKWVEFLTFIQVDYFKLILMAIFIDLLWSLYIRHTNSEVVIADNLAPLWEYFLGSNRNVIRTIVLITFLAVAAFFEELFYRFIVLNLTSSIMVVFGSTNTSIIFYVSVLLSSLWFGWAHYGNGGWIYVLNSFFAGVIFALAYINHGIIASWLLHFLWNGLIMIQLFSNYLKNEALSK